MSYIMGSRVLRRRIRQMEGGSMSRRRLFLVFSLAVALGCEALAGNPFETGDIWMRWNDEAKLQYISAYLLGNSRGFRDGCEMGQKLYSADKAGLPGEKCTGKFVKYSKSMEEYVKLITDYYSAYPNDRSVPIFKLIEGLSDARNLAIQKMHAYYGVGKSE